MQQINLFVDVKDQGQEQYILNRKRRKEMENKGFVFAIDKFTKVH